MPCSCIKGNYNYHISSLTNSAIIYEDNSEWQTGSGYVFPNEYEIQITSPLGSNYSTTVSASGRTEIKSTNLGLGDNLIFPDGIYCFTTSSCGKTYSRSRAYLPNAECCIQSLLSKGSNFETLKRISFLRDAIYVNAEIGKEQLAKEYFNILQKELSLLGCNC